MSAEDGGARLPEVLWPPLMHHISRRTLKDTVALYIRDLIFSGRLKPGSRIDQDAIAAQLGVSKLPVREALITLESAALVHIQPRRGAFVADLSRQDLVDHYRIYAAVSLIAAESAALTLTRSQIEDLRRNVETMSNATLGSDREELNRSFHRMINKAGGSRRVQVMLRSMETMVFGEFHAEDAGWNDEAVVGHAQILDALERGDGKAAGEEIRRHIEDGGAHVIAMLERRGFWSD